ncbi:MAG: cytochrome P450, partial [Ketobacteraceae bacterium]|nr:cytochrome P450 [Ketobacteraceae bacterium]
LEAVLKEVLRLHPPLIVLMRKVNETMRFKHYSIRKGDMVWTSPPVTHRMAHLFPHPLQFDPERYAENRGEDKNLMAYQPFGGGKHKCSGNAFAMFQIKAIFALLLREYEFELVGPPENYQDDYREMIVQPKSPCLIRYRRLKKAPFIPAESRPRKESITVEKNESSCPLHAAFPAPAQSLAVSVDPLLCQGHAMCMAEAGEVFRVDDAGTLTILKQNISPEIADRVRNAVRHCPNQALTLSEKTTKTTN